MHVVFRESHGLEETEVPTDLGQSPADLVVLSFSDSDLGAFAAAWHAAGPEDQRPTLRLANLVALRHPLSVDTYVEQTLSGAKGILVRLIGGAPYWRYGLEQLTWLAGREGIALAVIPADGRPDPQLDAASTVPASTLMRLKQLCDAGGPAAARAALAQLALAAGLYLPPVRGAKGLPEVGAWHPGEGLACPAATALAPDERPLALITFYRSYLAADDLAPMAALSAALEARGFRTLGLFAPSLKAPDAAPWLTRWAATLAPAIIVNATAFSGRGDTGASPLDAAGVPVLQVALSTAGREAWAEAERGLSPADLAMHVVLPEVDGRLFAGVVSFKEPSARDTALEFSRYVHNADRERIGAVADKAAALHRLATTPAAEKHLALVLSTYPGKPWQDAHAIGLDALASAEAILEDLSDAGYDTGTPAPVAPALDATRARWPVSAYEAALATLPAPLRQALARDWGDPASDPAVRENAFEFRAFTRGRQRIALQPDRAAGRDRKAAYHDVAATPCHGYVAFYLWLRHAAGAHAIVHLGAHGTLEWLPGKAVALSDTCWPEALTSPLPVVYPFISSDPGEAAQAKRRIGALTLGHLPPPLRIAGTPERLGPLEALLDEFSNADGLDPPRRARLEADIRAEAEAAGVAEDLGLTATHCPAEAITRIDQFVCDVKESQFGDGLHIYGRGADPASAAGERAGLLDALAGRRVPPGPSGSPHRGRQDVIPTGRNLFAVDPRGVPSRNAHAQGVRLAEDFIRRHLQDHGDYPKGLVIDLWGSATMRTAGEEFAMALHLLGVRPGWDASGARVSGFEIIPITELEHPRIDVTLRVSGLFRDVFPVQMSLFGQAVSALATRDEPVEWNPFAAKAPGARVFGPAPGAYGAGADGAPEDLSEEARAAAADAWLAASAYAFDTGDGREDRAALEARVAQADSFLHLHDVPETDLLAAADYAAHEGGFAAAKAQLGGGAASFYNLDNTDPERPRTRALSEELARVVRARASNPGWIDGMRRHGFRGAAEIAATLDHLAGFAHLTRAVPAHLFDLYHDATLGDAEVAAFLAGANPEAYAAMQARFRALHEAGLWETRRNSIRATLLEPLPEAIAEAGE
ncbi:MAG: cobaltochelatase subunit CobN [Pseudomonadota bacterium]